LTYGMRRSATSRRTCRSVTHSCSATAAMSNNFGSSPTTPNGAHEPLNATQESKKFRTPMHRRCRTRWQSRASAVSMREP
jgi:hypothetical protein